MDVLQPNPELYNVPFRADDFNGMPYRPLGKSGLRVSNVGLGTWKFGYPETGDGSRVNESDALHILDKAHELGVTFWDTANRYNAASGNSERIIGKWMKQNPQKRRDIVVATKVFGGMDGTTPNHSGLSRGNIIDSVTACLERLQLDAVDVLYFHGFDSTVNVEESLTAIEDLVRQDMIRYFAVSNFTVDQLKLYQAVTEKTSIRTQVQAVQNQFDPLNGQSGDHSGVCEYAADHGISFVAYSPLARGLLTERYLDSSGVGSGDRLYDEGTLDKDTAPSKMETVRKLAALAHEWDLKLNELVLAYMLTLPGMGPLIPSSSKVEQLESNAKAGRVNLSGEQLQKVHAVLQF